MHTDLLGFSHESLPLHLILRRVDFFVPLSLPLFLVPQSRGVREASRALRLLVSTYEREKRD